MWSCDCDENGKFSHQLFNLQPTEVNKDETCIRCGNYAVWDCGTKRAKGGTHLDKEATVFFLKSNKRKFCKDLRDAASVSGYKNSNTLSQAFKNKDQGSLYSKESDIIVVLGNHKELPEDILDRYKPRTVYCFEANTGELLHEAPLSKITKLTKCSKVTIQNNLRRQTLRTKNNYIFSYNKNFKPVEYLKTMEYSEDLSGSVSWRQDIIDFDESELGVSVIVDYYGTWKEKLYS